MVRHCLLLSVRNVLLGEEKCGLVRWTVLVGIPSVRFIAMGPGCCSAFEYSVSQ